MKIYALRTEKPKSVLGNLATSTVPAAVIADSYNAFLDTLVNSLDACSAEPCNIQLHSFKELEKTKTAWLDSGKKYLNFDSQSDLGIAVGVSRRFDLTTSQQLGITSRPGFDELQEQIAKIIAQHGHNFDILEDDIFTGGTLKFMIKLLQDASIAVGSVISGISSTRAVGDIPVKAVIYYQPRSLLELTDPRDYIFGSNHGGLVVSHLGRKFRVPYCQPFVNVTARSSINPNKTAEFSASILDANIKLHTSLGSLEYPASLLYPATVLKNMGINENATISGMLKTLKQSL